MRTSFSQKALLFNDEELQRIYEHAPHGYHSVNSQGLIVAMNDTELNWLGYERQEVVNRMFLIDLMHASTREWFPEFFKRFKEQGYVNNLEYELLRKDGAILSALISSVAIYDEAGNYLSSWSTVFNLTERKRTDRELRETTERFRLLVDSVSDYAMIILDKTGCVTSWNPGAERITGYKAGEIFGKHYYCFYTAAALQSSDPSDELQMAILNGRAELEGWRVRKDGSNFWAHVIVAPLRDEAGTPTSFSMIFRDLTQRRQSEEAIRTIHAELEKRVLSRTNELVSANRALEREVAGRRLTEELLQQSEARIAAILQSAGDGIISIDEWGTVELFNPAAEALFGFSAAEVLGRHIKMLMPSPHAELCEDYLLRYRQTREKRLIGLTRELTGLRKNGTTFPIELRVSEVNLASRRIFSGIIRDITDRKLAETAMRKRTQELDDTNRELVAKNQENEMFVYSVSHDLRSPLVNLQGFSKELGKGCDSLREILKDERIPDEVRTSILKLLDTKMGKSLGFIQAAVLRLSSIIDALLRLSRAGRVEYRWQWVDLRKIVSQILESVQTTVTEKRAALQVKSLLPVWGDPTALEQVFANLIVNALNYLDPDRDGVIEIGSLEPAKGSNVYYVKDNGLGISPAHHHKIFQLFQRVHAHVAKGEGMGLTIVARVVERHRGRVWVESCEGSGSTFFVSLPQQAPE